MADVPPDPSSRPMAEPETGPGPGMPRWLKVGILVLVAVVVLIVLLTFAGLHDPQPGGGHGP